MADQDEFLTGILKGPDAIPGVRDMAPPVEQERRLPKKGDKAAVIGLGVSNLPLIRFLKKKGLKVTGLDQKAPADFGQRYAELQALDVRLKLGPDYLESLRGYDWIFVTPGMRKNLPELQDAAMRGAILSSEMQLFLELCQAQTIGVTGSAGKTTTTTLIGEMLQADGRNVCVGGNIGRPLIEEVEEIPPEAWVVLELSSFQLETMTKSPNIALITNITPNHLDMHPTMEHYIAAKQHIYQHQVPGDWAVFNADDETLRTLAKRCQSDVALFSRRKEVDHGAFVDRRPDGEAIVFRYGLRDELICKVSEVRLPGLHNLENVLAATTVASLAGVRPETIGRVAREFAGVEHRLERVRELDGVAYYNDSIATTPARALAALRTIEAPTHVILGGYDKHLPFDELAREIARSGRVRTALLLGATAGQIEDALRRALAEAGAGAAGAAPEIVRAAGLPEAVEQARQRAKSGEVVLLSPACASYDMYENYAERGQHFKRLVQELA